MAAKFFYSNTAIETTLAGSATSSATSITVVAATGFPTSFPYVVAVGYGATDEELVKVTAASGTSLTVERGFSGTSAQSHSLGATVRHVYNAQDASDFRTHEVTGDDVHGVDGEVVGTGNTQTLANKTLTSPTIQAGALSGEFTGAPTLSGDLTLSGDPTFSGNPVFSGAPHFTNTSDTDATTFEAPAALDLAFEVEVTGDVKPRLQVTGNGGLYWSDGTEDADVILSRRDDSSDSLGTGLYTPNALWFTRPSANHDIIDARVEDDEGVRFGLEADGTLNWGDGTSTTTDVELARTAASTMKMTGIFSADVETSNVFTTTSGFSLNVAALRKTCGICTAVLYVDVTKTIEQDGQNGNITDQAMGTLPNGYKPHDAFEAIWSNGFASGSATFGTDGVVTLRTSLPGGDIVAGTTIRCCATFVL